MQNVLFTHYSVFINKRPFEPSQEEGGMTDIYHVTFIGGLTIQ